MSLLSRFRAIGENEKASVVRKLMESSTPDFDFFYLVLLSTCMATLGLLLNSPSIVIGSMLIAPILYPVLGVSLGLVMSNPTVMQRSFATLGKSLLFGLCASALLAFIERSFTAEPISVIGNEIISRTEPSLSYFLVAIISGLAVSFALARPGWSEALPGVAISVALLPPLAVVGIGVAHFDFSIIFSSLIMLGVNVAGIIFASMVTFSLMNLYEKQEIAESTIRKEEERIEKQAKAIEEVDGSYGVKSNDHDSQLDVSHRESNNEHHQDNTR